MATHHPHDPSGRDQPLSKPNRRSFLLASVSSAAAPVFARARDADVTDASVVAAPDISCRSTFARHCSTFCASVSN
jgi:hypothetical protein